MSIDTINAVFEVLGSAIIWMNLVKLRQDRRIEGVYWPVTAFYVSWGCWSAYYYFALGHWWSFAGQLMMILANTCWLILAIDILYFKDKQS